MSYCAIDFGTSNSAIAIPANGAQGMRLVPLENGQPTMPTAVFYCTDADDLPPAVHRPPVPELPRAFGRAAVQAYVDGYEGRLMRSMKSVLGTALIDQTTEVGHGHGVKYLDIVTGYLRHLRTLAEADGGQPLSRVVMGRPVFFVDDDADRDAQAQASLEAAARAVGFADIAFQYEPIAAALDHEQRAEREELVLVADIGGGTSDFSVVRVGPERAQRLDRRDDILANHGVHIAGTDFDRRVSLGSVMPPLGFGAFGPEVKGQPARPVPSRVYFDLAGTNVSGLATVSYGKLKTNSGGSNTWTSFGIRPQYNFNDNFSLAAEVGYDTGKTDSGDTPKLMKLTLAPQLALAKGFWARPVFRAFVTYAKWNDDAGTQANGVFGDKRNGMTYGLQVESWW